MGAMAAAVHKKGENALEYVVEMLKMLSREGTSAFGLASSTAVEITNSMEHLANSSLNEPVIIGHVFWRITATDKPQPLKLENATLIFEGRIYPAQIERSDAEAFAEKIRSDAAKESENFIRKANGDFAFAIAEGKRLIIGRNPTGSCPLYFGQNEHLTAFASERKALWKNGIEKVQSFPPGFMLIIDENGSKLLHVETPSLSNTRNMTMQRASEELGVLLQNAVNERVAGLKEVAVAFSGGLDSSLIAFLAKKAGVCPQLIHVSLENQPETEHAVKMAEEMKLPIHVYTYTDDNVKESLQRSIWLIEENDLVKVAVGLPICWVAEKTSDLGIKVLLSGHGADELFGGYKRYETIYTIYGEAKARKAMFNDILRFHETNLDRDNKICSFYGVELRLPFLAYTLVRFAAGLPAKLKIGVQGKEMRKLILRYAAKNLELPKHVIERPKKAIQYATGVDKAIRRLAKQENLSVREYLAKNFAKVFENFREYCLPPRISTAKHNRFAQLGNPRKNQRFKQMR